MQNAFIAPLAAVPRTWCGFSQVSTRRHAHFTDVRNKRSTVHASAISARTVEFTPLGNNTFVLEGSGTRLLIDPFLEDDLVFFTPAFFRLIKDPSVQGLPRAGRFDAVVLTQYLPDHAHEPTLKRIDKATPVIAPAQAEALLSKLGFRNVTLLRPGETTTPVKNEPNVTITAGPGSLVGPPGSEPQLALVFSFGGEAGAPLTVYHEPHGYHDDAFLRKYNGVDAAIAPIIAATIPALRYKLVNGATEAVDLCKRMQPKTLVAFDNSGGVASGFLTRWIAQGSSIDDLWKALETEKELSDMNVLFPQDPKNPVVIAATANELVPEGARR